MDIVGAYPADRAAALSGVPKRTVYHWARKGLLIPSVSSSPLIWSYTDLLALRTIYWLRQPKKAHDRDVPGTSMSKVRKALQELRRLDLDLFEEGRPIVAVTLAGEVTVNVEAGTLQVVEGQYLHSDIVNLVGPFEGLEGTHGPDLLQPREHLRILPRKLSGAPHIEGSRVPTESIFALAKRGFDLDRLAQLYPSVSEVSLTDSVDLEEQLQQNIQLKRAA